MTEQLNLLPPIWPNGFDYTSDFITREEEQFLLDFAQNLKWEDYEMHGVVAFRKVYHFSREKRPIPSELDFIVKRCARFLGVDPQKISHVLFTKYPVGAPIGWHRDAPMYESLVGVSLKSACTMKLKPYDPTVSPLRNIDIAPRSIYKMTGESRWKWEHHIPAVKEERYSLTMRTSVD